MQPYFFPYLGYFALIRHSDQWLVFDVVKYQPKSWMNRNRILEPNKGEQYVSVPVDRASGRGLDEIRVHDAAATLVRLRRQLEAYRTAAPYHGEVLDLVERTFAAFGSNGLLRDLNCIALDYVCERLGLRLDRRNVSALGLDLSSVCHPGQWALEICAQLGASAYVNPPGGRDIFRPEEWRARKIALLFTPGCEVRYPVRGQLSFRANLSILDCMMWLEPAQIRAELDRMAPFPVDELAS